VPTRGLIVCGRLGVGKTTVVQEVARRTGAEVPITTTTRRVSELDLALEQTSDEEFNQGVIDGDLHCPILSAGVGYAWATDQFNLLTTGSRLIFSARPYTALSVSSFISGLQPVWLTLPEDLRQQRLAQRDQERDRTALALARSAYDEEDDAYARLFRVRLLADDSAPFELASLYDC
jgi:cytidylate kinase